MSVFWRATCSLRTITETTMIPAHVDRLPSVFVVGMLPSHGKPNDFGVRASPIKYRLHLDPGI